VFHPPQNRESVIKRAMRNGQNKRMRGRNRKGQNPLTRIYESNGPDVKIRGTASHVAEKYVQLARDAQASGDPVAAENYFQHAEHYFRLIAAAQEQFRQTQPYFRAEGDGREDSFDDFDEDQPMVGEGPVGGRDPQPYPPAQAYGREAVPFGGREHATVAPRSAAAGRAEQPAEVERLPAFITGNGPQPQPFAGYGQPQPQNGFDGQPDRFPLHRRRRRRHGPRGEIAAGAPGAAASEDTGAPQGTNGPSTE
jgi:Domain of unknown function (DUF4167)